MLLMRKNRKGMSLLLVFPADDSCSRKCNRKIRSTNVEPLRCQIQEKPAVHTALRCSAVSMSSMLKKKE